MITFCDRYGDSRNSHLNGRFLLDDAARALIHQVGGERQHCDDLVCASLAEHDWHLSGGGEGCGLMASELAAQGTHTPIGTGGERWRRAEQGLADLAASRASEA